MILYNIKVEYFNKKTGSVEVLDYTTQHEGDYKYRLISMLTDKDIIITSIKIFYE